MGLSRIWGVRGSQCCCFQQIVERNIEYALLLIPSLKTYLMTKKSFKNENLHDFCEIFFEFSVIWTLKISHLFSKSGDPKTSTRGARPSLK